MRAAEVPVSLTEFLSLLEALQSRVFAGNVDRFYYVSRAALVKDERHFDRFDKVFGAHFRGSEERFNAVVGEIPVEWLRRQATLVLSDEEKAHVEALGGWEALMDTLRRRLKEQGGRHQGGSTWIGTAGTSPFGANGYEAEGVRIGQQGGGQGRAAKVWDKRQYRNLDTTVELGTRNIKLALRRLRRFAREGAAEELDMEDTVRSTANNAGYLDIKMVPERHNAARVLLCLDVGGSMYPHVRACEELFSAARSEFKHLEYFYFHNFLYESVWKDNRRRHTRRVPTLEVLRKYGPGHKVIFVGDATMSPHEITQPGGSVEHYNEEAGAVWFRRLTGVYPALVWLNPEPASRWEHTASIRITRQLLGERMFPLTPDGIQNAM